MPAKKNNRPKPNLPQSGRETAVSLPEDGEVLAVITAAIAAFCEEETPVSIAAFREVATPEETKDFFEEETPAPVSSFVARTIKRRG